MKEIEGERIKLRKLKLSDAEDIYKNLNDEEVIRWLLRIPFPYTLEKAVKFIKRTHYRIKKNSSYAFGIELRGKIIGESTFLTSRERGIQNSTTGSAGNIGIRVCQGGKANFEIRL